MYVYMQQIFPNESICRKIENEFIQFIHWIIKTSKENKTKNWNNKKKNNIIHSPKQLVETAAECK